MAAQPYNRVFSSAWRIFLLVIALICFLIPAMILDEYSNDDDTMFALSSGLLGVVIFSVLWITKPKNVAIDNSPLSAKEEKTLRHIILTAVYIAVIMLFFVGMLLNHLEVTDIDLRFLLIPLGFIAAVFTYFELKPMK